MNVQYARARSSDERIIIAILEANKEFYQTHKHEEQPGMAFYLGFLEPFLERERKQAMLDELHLETHGTLRVRERELLESINHWRRLCEKKLVER